MTTSSQILEYNTTIKIEGQRKITESSFYVQINNKDQSFLSNVKISLSPGEEFDLLEAYIINSNGEIERKLKKSDLITRNDLSYGTFYQDDIIKEFNLYWNEYPYQIKYSYKTIEEQYLYVSYWLPIFYKGVPVRNSKLHLEVPEDYEIAFEFSKEINFNEKQLDGKRFLTWSTENSEIKSDELYSPPLMELIPSVSVVPINYKYGVEGKFNSWVSFGDWLINLNEGIYDLPFTEEQMVKQQIAGESKKLEIIRKLYHLLQDQTKYINISIDVGGMKSYPASYVAINKYGDCKALTTYMKALLDVAGIESFYTVINAGKSVMEINRNLPSQQFNHVILTIPLDGDTVWLENTSNYNPFGYLGTFTQGREALLIKSNESKIITIPNFKEDDVLEKRIFNYVLNEEGEGSLEINQLIKGEAFEDYSYYKVNKSEVEQEQFIKRNLPINNFDLTQWEILHLNRDNDSLNVNLEGSCASQIRTLGGMKLIKPLKISIPDFEEPLRRRNSIQIDFPINKLDTSRYKITNFDGSNIKFPNDMTIKTKYGSYEASFTIVNKEILVKEHFKLKRGEYILDEYPEFFSFIDSINKYKKSAGVIIR